MPVSEVAAQATKTESQAQLTIWIDAQFRSHPQVQFLLSQPEKYRCYFLGRDLPRPDMILSRTAVGGTWITESFLDNMTKLIELMQTAQRKFLAG